MAIEYLKLDCPLSRLLKTVFSPVKVIILPDNHVEERI